MNDRNEAFCSANESVAVAESPVAATSTRTSDPAPRHRLAYFDNLRTVLTAFVVVHHAAVGYSHLYPLWYYSEPPTDASATALDIMLALDQTFFMGFFFLISGYFVPASYDRKGGRVFLRDRLIRLGIPLMVFVLVLSPLLRAGYNPGPMWFVEVLLVFCALYVLAGRMRSGPPAVPPSEVRRIGFQTAVGALLGYTLLLSLLTYLWRIAVPLLQFWPTVGLPTPAYMPQYASLFVVGAMACRRGWAEALPVSAGWFGLALPPVASVALAILSAAVGRLGQEALGHGTWQSLVVSTWESFAAVGVITAVFMLVRQRFNRQGPLMAFMSQHAYTVYFIHPLVLVCVSYAFAWLRAIAVVKFAIVVALGIPLCWAFAYLVRSLPYAKRVL